MEFFYYGKRTPDKSLIDLLTHHTGTIGIDTETVSLKDKTLIGIGVAISPTDAFFIPYQSPHMAKVKQLLSDKRVLKVFHNSRFDLEVLSSLGVPIINWVDTLIAAHSLGLPAKLGLLVFELFNESKPDISELIGTGKKQLTMLEVPIEKVAERCCLDCEYTLRVWETLRNNLPAAFWLDMQVFPVLLQMEQRGILVDVPRVQEYRELLTTEHTKLKEKASAMGFNPGSPKQVGATLEVAGLSLRYNKNGNPDTSEETLKKYFSSEPIANLVLEYRKVSHQLSWFNSLITKHLQSDGRIHGTFSLSVAATGRIAASNPNLQNIEGKLRDIFIPSPGNLAHAYDFSQIELRVMAWFSGDKTMAKIFADPRGDIHTETATLLNIERKIAKNVNFTIPYGGDEYTLEQRYNIPLATGEALLQAHKTRFPELWDWIKSKQQEVKQRGYLETWLGRRRYFPEISSGIPRLVNKALREAINHPIQGTAAEILKLAMLQWAAYPMNNSIHDECWFDAPPEFLITVDVKAAPFNTPIKRSVGLNWGSLVEM